MLCFQLFDLHRKICEIGHLNKIFLKRVALATSPSTLHLSDLQRIIINRFWFEYIRYLKIKYLFLQIPYNGNQRYFSTFHTMELASMLKCFNSWSNIYLFFFSTIDESAGASDFSRSFVVFFFFKSDKIRRFWRSFLPAIDDIWPESSKVWPNRSHRHQDPSWRRYKSMRRIWWKETHFNEFMKAFMKA